VHVVIMGCGRVGSTLARTLEKRGHTVAIIDQSADAFRRLSPNYTGRTVTGMGFDREILIEAGIEDAEAFAAVSNGDNSNILAARVARETFGINNVVARIYDPGRAEVYQRLGIPTVGTVRWTVDQMMRRMLPEGSEPEWRDRAAFDIEKATGARVAFLTRLGEGLLPKADTVIQEGDLVHVVMLERDAAAVESQLGTKPEEL
jgi:trk system potassium uptake protein TrkA